ncbi:MAG: DNA cytosine methyltransferase [Lachnospiraceae bacterium]|nr:DNA cytosine methyltransferase [Lachnospiraceae bacterium]
MTTYRFIDFFAGIGGIRLAFESAFCECVFSSEICKKFFPRSSNKYP